MVDIYYSEMPDWSRGGTAPVHRVYPPVIGRGDGPRLAVTGQRRIGNQVNRRNRGTGRVNVNIIGRRPGGRLPR